MRGQVQGVGFRPFVYQLAHQLGRKGWVSNTLEGLKVVLNAQPEEARHFYELLLSKAPALARITHHSCQIIDYQDFEGFEIIESIAEGTPNLLISPDFALCPHCQAELFDAHNRRYGYVFLTCTQCGPRYSILEQLPYDRPHTTMQAFAQCPACTGEYQNLHDRRYFSQTNSCVDCGLAMQLFDSQGEEKPFATPQALLDFVIGQLQTGHIVALKGIGGYLLLADATSAATLRTLRQRKNRPHKPFAVLYADEEALRRELVVSDLAWAHLQSAAAPIVLLPLGPAHSLAQDEIAPCLDKIGVMRPYAPLLAWLGRGLGKPLVATSANLSQSPLVFEDAPAQSQLGRLADWVLSHNRAIVFPQDDSVLQISDFEAQSLILRRARGYAPTFLYDGPLDPGASVLAVGAMLKSTFTLQHQGQLYVSQYLGDLQSYDTQARFETVLQRLCQVLQARPQLVLRDGHPGYPNSEWAEAFAQSQGIPCQAILHHEAHFGAVLAENHLLSCPDKVLGLIWDGTGYGADGQVWGGEFYLFEEGKMHHLAHIGEFPHFLGDKMSREPRLSAFALSQENPALCASLAHKFSPSEWQAYTQLVRKAPLRCRSMGRLFDAVASQLGLADFQSYEGEAALYLEVCARNYFKKNGFRRIPAYLAEAFPPDNVATFLFAQVAKDCEAGKDKTWIAARFHCALLELIAQTAARHQVRHLAFSGGVFQNSLLLDLIKKYLSSHYNLYFHKQLSPNDECISLGQWACAQLSTRTQSGIENRVF
ncbi:MAG: carbamoyltransferase HypF [Microscillaceae bacterium]